MNPHTSHKRMDFSLYFFAADEGYHGDKYYLVREASRFADAHDFRAVWVPERHFSTFGDRFANPAVIAAAIAAETTQVRLRAGSVVMPLHDPIRVAEEWSMVDQLSHGRVEVAAASGWHPNDFSLAPQNFERRFEVMCEHLQTVRALWAGESVMRTNGAGQPVEIRTYPRPVQAELPVWITAGGSRATYEYAGKLGANLLTNFVVQAQHDLRGHTDHYYASLLAHGHDPNNRTVAAMIHTFVADTPSEVEQAVKGPLRHYLSQFNRLFSPVAQASGLDNVKAHNLLVEMGFERHYRDGGLFGTPEHCVGRIRELKDHGVNEVACLIDFGIEPDLVLSHLDGIVKLRELVREEERELVGEGELAR